MSKKIRLLALSVISAALFALPAVASATPAHITPPPPGTNPEPFTVTPVPGNPSTTLETVDGELIHCTNGTTGNGNWHSTTTGTLTLTFHGCFTKVFGFNVSCTTHPDPAGTITTTKLPFHLIMIDHPVGSAKKPGVLITPGENNSFAHFTCGGVNKTVEGNGVIGTITTPPCNTASTTATLSFQQAATGLQTHTTYTGVNYHLLSGGKKAAQIGEGRIHFNNPHTLVCT